MHSAVIILCAHRPLYGLTFCATVHTLSTSALAFTNLLSNVRHFNKKYGQQGMMILGYARRFSNRKCSQLCS